MTLSEFNIKFGWIGFIIGLIMLIAIDVADIIRYWRNKKMRSINADKLREDVLDLPNCYNGFSDTYDKATILDLIDEQPTVDAVEVVRCKDCKWWKTNYSWNGNEHKICAREAYEPLRNAEDFCSYGERIEDVERNNS